MKHTRDSTILFCSIVRDCGRALSNNIRTIEKIGGNFKDYSVIVFENNSVDTTKNVLTTWMERNKRVTAFMNDFDESKYKNIPLHKEYSGAFSKRRIQKMADYRNLYMDHVQGNHLRADCLCVVDLDVAGIDVAGVLSSFELLDEWDAVAANCWSRAVRTFYRKDYHDAYALVEEEMIDKKQSLKDIAKKRTKWSGLKKGMPPVKIASAYGGLCLYRFDAVKHLKYRVIENNFEGVEVLCEHVGLHRQMIENGFGRICVNPAMIIEYEHLDLRLIIQRIKEVLR